MLAVNVRAGYWDEVGTGVRSSKIPSTLTLDVEAGQEVTIEASVDESGLFWSPRAVRVRGKEQG